MSKKGKKYIAQPDHNHDEYDLKASLGRVNQRRNFAGDETISAFESTQSKQQPIDSSAIEGKVETSSGMYLQLSDTFSQKYDKLKDDISSFGDRIYSANSDLRKELEGKISEKVGNKIFYGAVAVIVVIAGIIYTLSYGPLITTTDKNESEIKSLWDQNIEIKSRLKDVETSTKTIGQEIDTLIKIKN